MSAIRDAYARIMEDLVRSFMDLGDQAIAQSVTAMQKLKAEIAFELTSIPEVNAYHIQEVISRLDDDIAQYQATLTRTLDQGLSRAARLGALLVVEPLNALGLEVTWVSANPLENILRAFSADLITGIVAELRADINAALRLGAMGGLTPYQIMVRVTNDILGLRADKITGIAYKAEEIVRTELTRIFNMAIQSQQFATQNQIPGVQKAWMATGDWRTRITHLKAHSTYTANPIPIAKPFIVGGAFLMYPGDPAGPPSEVINCRCISATIHPQIGYIETLIDKQIRAEIRRRENENYTVATQKTNYSYRHTGYSYYLGQGIDALLLHHGSLGQ